MGACRISVFSLVCHVRPARCQPQDKYPPLRVGATLDDSEVLYPTLCTTRRNLCVVSGLTDSYYDMHSGCACNELRSLRTRVLMTTPIPDSQAIGLIRQEAVKLGNQLQFVPVSYEQLITMFPSHKRVSYNRALEDLRFRSIDLRKDGFVTAFIKAERLLCGPQDCRPDMYFPDEVGKDPRMIQFRSMRFNLALGRYTRPLEKSLYQLRCPIAGTRMIAKGLNPHKRGALLSRIWGHYDLPMALSLDLSRFDAHVHVEFMAALHQFYLAACPSKEFADLLAVQLKNRGRTMNGFRYKTSGGVMSGDMTTALGNCAIVVLVYNAFRQCIPGSMHKWTLIDDGDDHVIIGDANVVRDLAKLLPTFWAMLGHKLTVEGLVDQFEKIVFCKHYPYQIMGKTVMVPDVTRTLSTSLSIPGRVLDPYGWLQQVSYCRAIIHRGVPVLGPLFAKLTTQLGRPTQIETGIRYWLNAYTKELDDGKIQYWCLPEDRVTFAVNTGYSISDQFRIEALSNEIVNALLGSGVLQRRKGQQ